MWGDMALCHSSPGMLVCVSEVKTSTNTAHMVDTPRRHGERGKQQQFGSKALGWVYESVSMVCVGGCDPLPPIPGDVSVCQ